MKARIDDVCQAFHDFFADMTRSMTRFSLLSPEQKEAQAKARAKLKAQLEMMELNDRIEWGGD